MAGPGFLRAWRSDALASIVVFLVALPLSMGIAIASGVPIERAAATGIVTAVIGGLIVGPLSGSPLQVSGPAAGLAVMVSIFVQEHGFRTLGLIILLGGLTQLVAGLLRFGPVFRAVSPALIEGMLAGIGVLIFASQFHVMVDDYPPGTGKEFGGVINLWRLPEAVWKGVSEPLHQPAALLGLLTITIVVLWALFAPKRLKLVPAPLLGVVIATGVSVFFDLDVKRIPVPERLLDAIDPPQLDVMGKLGDGAIWLAGLSLAFVASAESLLTATAADTMQRRGERTDYSRELVAQGIGNMICGALNVLPITGVIVRTSTNIMAGAQTRLSAFLHGAWMLLFVLLLPGVLSMAPIATLAAVLVYTGVKLARVAFLRKLWTQDRAEALVYLVTFAGVVGLDLITGIVMGNALALARLLYAFSHLEITMEQDPDKPTLDIRLKGAATFIRLPQLAAALETAPPGADAHIHLNELTYVDHACLSLLVDWAERHQATGGPLHLDWAELHNLFQEKAWRGPPAAVVRTQGGA